MSFEQGASHLSPGPVMMKKSGPQKSEDELEALDDAYDDVLISLSRAPLHAHEPDVFTTVLANPDVPQLIAGDERLEALLAAHQQRGAALMGWSENPPTLTEEEQADYTEAMNRQDDAADQFNDVVTEQKKIKKYKGKNLFKQLHHKNKLNKSLGKMKRAEKKVRATEGRLEEILQIYERRLFQSFDPVFLAFYDSLADIIEHAMTRGMSPQQPSSAYAQDCPKLMMQMACGGTLARDQRNILANNVVGRYASLG